MLMRFDPFREVDQLVRQPWAGLRFAHLPMNAYRRGDEFVAEFDLPGVDRDSIDVTVERNVLQVTAQRQSTYGDDDQVVIAERPQGTVSRQLFLGQGLDTQRISATYDDGVLTVVIPVAETAKPHKIQIRAGGDRQAVEAGSTA